MDLIITIRKSENHLKSASGHLVVDRWTTGVDLLSWEALDSGRTNRENDFRFKNYSIFYLRMMRFHPCPKGILIMKFTSQNLPIFQKQTIPSNLPYFIKILVSKYSGNILLLKTTVVRRAVYRQMEQHMNSWLAYPFSQQSVPVCIFVNFRLGKTRILSLWVHF